MRRIVFGLLGRFVRDMVISLAILGSLFSVSIGVGWPLRWVIPPEIYFSGESPTVVTSILAAGAFGSLFLFVLCLATIILVGFAWVLERTVKRLSGCHCSE